MASFGHKISYMINSTILGLALSMAKEVGILQVLLEAERPLTSAEVADKKQLKERYVRELLCCLATAEVVHAARNEDGNIVYFFEAEEKQVFQTQLMPFVSFPALMTTLFAPIKACLPISGPNGSRYSEQAHVWVDEFCLYNVDMYVEKILQYVDGLKKKLENGIEVIEFGCGKGSLLARLAQMFPKSTFVASEVVPSLLDQLKVELGHVPNIRYEINDLCSLPDPPNKQYDWIYCTNVVHDLPNPKAALKAIRKRVREPNGIFTMVDIATSGNPIDDKGDLKVATLYATSTFICIPESYQRDDSQALGACWGRKTAINTAKAAGFNVTSADMIKNVSIYMCTP